MTTNKPAAPNKIARAAVPEQWGTIHKQVKIGAGVYGFLCSGHGGIIVLQDKAVKTDGWAEVADLFTVRGRSAKVMEGRFLVTGRRRSLISTSNGFSRLAFADATHDVLVLEEDCDWALAVLAFEADWTVTGGYTVFSSIEQARRLARALVDRWLR